MKTVLLLFPALAVLLGLSYGADWLLRAENFPVRSIRFEGPFRHVTQKELETAALAAVRGNFFLVDLDVVKQRIESVPWVHRASVRRQFPQTIDVRYTEQRPVARWGEASWVNASGEVVRLRDVDDAGLPRFDGPEGTSAQVLSAYGEFSRALASTGLRIGALALDSRRSWRLDLERADAAPLTLVLDHEQPQARLERFARVYSITSAEELSSMRQVDLRYTNGFAVEWDRTAARLAGATTAAVRRPNEG